jgi:FAD/FMN-containing dehydrogenase
MTLPISVVLPLQQLPAISYIPNLLLAILTTIQTTILRKKYNMRLSGWGNYPVTDTVVKEPAALNKSVQLLEKSRSPIPRGWGRAYGDSALNDLLTVTSLNLDSMVSFDENTGELVTEAGVTFEDIIETFAPRGWFLPVTPGTKFITAGGAAASDVHGKNHHSAGSFGSHISWLEIWTSSKGTVVCSREQNSDLFWATIGGHGLTGFITKVAFRLIKIPSIYIHQTLIKNHNLEEIMDIFEHQDDQPYSVAWIDCQITGKYLGRSLYMGGDFAAGELLNSKANNPYKFTTPLKLFVPINFPSFVLNSFTIKAFNALYYNINLKHIKKSLVSYDKFFYPLDSIHNWNKIYGKRGFLQYQFVLPMESAREGLPAILKAIAIIGTGSFLAVLKLFGDQPKHSGNISFPQKGYTLALDFPIKADLFPKLDELDKMVSDYNGKLYLTKDSRTSSKFFFKSYEDEIAAFLQTKTNWDDRQIFSSLQSRRLKITS